ncbi:hypothetical protein [Heyndrickxia oleronia]|uniref:Uncharacterized protein n=1 Tax=Heyndrickxia oleronia TaxID=38875 RepID=A0AAW6SSP7_9BACI|nr:hypothetical protein [Heyndrickxia oleronia]MDH5160328.1 hypothetical protein [Heyndrickxia oleronia]
MAEYTGMALTKKGRMLQVKAESGVLLKFTKVSIGDGEHTGQNIDDLTSLISPKKDLGISGIQVDSSGYCRIHTSITNEGLTEPFYVREIGLFAEDPDEGEILFGITFAKEADFLPANGGTTGVNAEFEIIVVVGNAKEITAVISNTGYVSKEEFNKLVIRVDAMAQRAEKNTDDISKVSLRLTNLEQSFSNNFTNNQFTEDFYTLDDVIVSRGVYDSVNKRLVM